MHPRIHSKNVPILVFVICILARISLAQSPVTVSINTSFPGPAIPTNFLGLSFETGNLKYNGVGVSGYMFDSSNAELVTLFTNLGIKSLRIGGISVDYTNGFIPPYIPTNQDIDALFRFAAAADVSVIFSLHLANGNPSQDAGIAGYTWTNYNQYLDCFAIGNEPDGYPAGLDPAITNFSSYLATWTTFADTVTDSVPNAKFGAPDAAYSTPWTADFANAEKGSPIVKSIFSHYYVMGNSGSLTVEQIITNLLSSRWDSSGYPTHYNQTQAIALTNGFPYRMTEFNSYVAPYPGTWGGNNSFASALFALDGTHWWAANGCAGVNFHTYLGKYNGTVYYDTNGNYQIFPIAYGMKAFDLGGHGNVESVSITNTAGLNLTAYAVGNTTNLYITVINREYGTNARNAAVTIQPTGLVTGSAAAIYLIATNGGAAATNDITIGGATITNNAPWQGQWTTLAPLTNGQCVVTVPASSAAIVEISGVWLFPPVLIQDLPLIVVEPTGHSYQYSIGVESSTQVSYQWYQDGTSLAGQTNATYTATAGNPGTEASYYVVATNVYGAVTSSISSFTSIAPPTNSSFTSAILQFKPVGYWPMHEVEASAPGDIETNYGSLGLLGTGYYPDWASPQNQNGSMRRGAPGALANDSDSSVSFTHGGNPAAGTYTNILVVPHTLPLSTLNPPFSVECWFYPTNTSSDDIWDQNGYEGLNAGGSGNGNGAVGGIRLVWSNGTNTGFQVYTYDNTSTVLSAGFSGNSGGPPVSPMYNWYHLVVTCDAGTNISLYTNGVLAFTDNSAPYSPDYWTPLAIGGGRGGTRAVAGYIDEVAVYTNVITDIAQHYSDGISESHAGVYVSDVMNDHPTIYLRMDAPAVYSPPAFSSWPPLINYGSAGANGVYSPGTIPGILPGPVNADGLPVGGLSGLSVPQFSGVSSFADAGYAPSFNPTGPLPFTVTALFRGYPCDGRYNTIVGHSDDSWNLSLNNTGHLFWRFGTNTAANVTSLGVYNDGQWHQVSAVYTPNSNPTLSGTNALYVDGELDNYTNNASPNGFGPGTNLDVLIGSDPEYTNNPAGVGRQFAGQICEVALLTNALTAVQVQMLYQIATTPLPDILSFTNSSAGQLQLNWNYGTLQSATNVNGPYTDLTNTSPPLVVPTTNEQQFYRVKEN